MFLKYIVKLSIAASFAFAGTMSHSTRKPGRINKLALRIRKFNPQMIVTENPYYGGFDFRSHNPTPKPLLRKKIVKHYNILVPNLEGGFERYPFTRTFYQNGHKTTGFGSTKKFMKQYKEKYYQETLEELKKNMYRKKFSIAEKYANIPEAQKKFKLLFKKKCGKSIKKANTQDLKLMNNILEKDKKLEKCTEEFRQQLKKKKYHLRLKECVEGNKEECEKAKKDLKNVAKTLYWKNYTIYTIIRSSLLAGHPKNFKNEEL